MRSRYLAVTIRSAWMKFRVILILLSMMILPDKLCLTGINIEKKDVLSHGIYSDTHFLKCRRWNTYLHMQCYVRLCDTRWYKSIRRKRFVPISFAFSYHLHFRHKMVPKIKTRYSSHGDVLTWKPYSTLLPSVLGIDRLQFLWLTWISVWTKNGVAAEMKPVNVHAMWMG